MATKILFGANDRTHSTELWMTDGTAAGIYMVDDIYPGGAPGFYPQYITSLGNGNVVFSANDGTNGAELRVTDGTAPVDDINPGAAGSSTKTLFNANDGAHGYELWVTDGTTAGTSLVKDIAPGSYSSLLTDITSLGNGKAVFSANDGTHGAELWVTDATAAGTALVDDINPGVTGSALEDLTALGNGKAVFRADDGTHGAELWVTNGTAAGTALVKDIYPGATTSTVQYLTALGNGKAVFRANDGTHGSELWVTDGTAAGTALVKDIYPGITGSFPSYLTALGNGKALFSAADGTHGAELWVTDGTAAGTALVDDIYPGNGSSFPNNIAVFGNGKALFEAYNGYGAHPIGRELWVTDGTAAGTALVKDIDPGGGSSFVNDITVLGNGTAVFAANDGTHGVELWVTDGTGAGTALVKDIYPGGTASSPKYLTALGNGKAVFEANDGTRGYELWVTDGTAAGTALVDDILPGIGSSLPSDITAIGNGKAVFRVSDGTHGRELWVTDGTAAGTALGDDIYPGSDSSNPADFTVLPPVCFCRGTLILTEQGEMAVEDLAVGDRVKTLSGALRPIVWIGLGRDLVTRANKLARPVVVRRGALDDNVPDRDLYLTHGHALYLDSAIGGVLIPVENLINHRSILWDENARVVEYYHIELAGHDVLLANGAPAESYYDAGNRALFHNARRGSLPGGATPSFAPVLNGGGIVDQVWAELFERAGGRITSDTTDEPDLHLVVDGTRLDPAAVAGCAYSFTLDGPPASPLVLCSRSGVPSLLGIARHDHRQLGVAVSRIEFCQSGIVTTIDYAAAFFAAGGCHPVEDRYCWTDGELALPARLFGHLTGGFTLTVHIERPGMRYPLPAGTAASGLAA